MAYAEWSDLVAAVGDVARLARYTGETDEAHPNTDAELQRYSDEVDGYLRKAGVSLPLDDDALASPWNRDFVDLALPSVIKGDNVPERYKTAAERAQKRFEMLAAGKIEYADPDDSTPAGATTAPLVYANTVDGLDEDNWPAGFSVSL